MSEIPEHLLRRSKERRAALSGEGGDSSPNQGSEGTASAAVAPTPAASAAVPAEAGPVDVAPTPLPPYVEASLRRPRIPRWALPVLVILPVWGYIYVGALNPAEETVVLETELALGQQVYQKCASCHGANGEGGVGRPLDGGEVLATFPNPAQHVDWIANGSPVKGTPYGDPNRPGGQRISQGDGFGPMPPFASQLSAEEINAVVRYEREVLSGEGGGAAAGATAGASGGGH